MNKKLFGTLLMGSLLMGGTFVSCQDYDDEIDDLQGQITANASSIKDLQALVSSGSVITGVSSTNNGVTVTLSNGQSFNLTNGKDGANGTNGTNGKDGVDGKDGVNGKDAAVWTIGTDGFWYCDNVKTEYKALGVDGKDGKDGVDGVDGKDGVNGTNGTNGKDGKDGKDGKYYVPNTATGCFDIYQNGELVEATEISWKAAGVTAIKDGNKLTFAGVDGSEDALTVTLGKDLGSVAIVTDEYDTHGFAAATFYSIVSYIDETGKTNQYISNNKKAWDLASVSTFQYRLNPSNAYTDDATGVGFINRTAAITRAAKDADTLVVLKDEPDFTTNPGFVTVKASLKAGAKIQDQHQGSTDDNHLNTWGSYDPYWMPDTEYKDIFAIQIQQSTGSIVTSDFASIERTPLDWFVIVPAKKENVAASANINKYRQRYSIINSTFPEAQAMYYSRRATGYNSYSWYPLTQSETSYLTNTSSSTANGGYAADLALYYQGSIDLDTIVNTLTFAAGYKYVEDLGFDVKYEFSLPEKFLGLDNETNQQKFVSLDAENVLSVKPEWGTSAINRTPVVAVNAKVDGKLIASAYIKFIITSIPAEPKPALNVTIAPEKNFIYQNLKSTQTQVVKMDWEKFNKEVYAATGTSVNGNNDATGFFNQYYFKQVDVIATKYNTTTKKDEEVKFTSYSNSSEVTNGIYVDAFITTSTTSTAPVEIKIDNKALTQHTYVGDDEKGTKYTVNVIYGGNYGNGDIVLTQEFYVVCNHVAYPFNEYFYRANFELMGDTYANAFLCHGAMDGSKVVFASSVSKNQFKTISKNNATYNFWQYYNNATINNNVAYAELAYATWPTTNAVKQATVTPATPAAGNDDIECTNIIETAFGKNLTVKNVILVNGETCKSLDYSILYVNPFTLGYTKAAEMKDNAAKQSTDIKKVMQITDYTNAAYTVASGALAGTGMYKGASVAFTYDFVKDAAFVDITNNVANLDIDPATGIVTYERLTAAASLAKEFTVYVNVTAIIGQTTKSVAKVPVTVKPIE